MPTISTTKTAEPLISPHSGRLLTGKLSKKGMLNKR